MELEPEPKVGTETGIGTVKNSYGSTTLHQAITCLKILVNTCSMAYHCIAAPIGDHHSNDVWNKFNFYTLFLLSSLQRKTYHLKKIFAHVVLKTGHHCCSLFVHHNMKPEAGVLKKLSLVRLAKLSRLRYS
jgi:hypothetical protein